jgi:hypothetical protein
MAGPLCRAGWGIAWACALAVSAHAERAPLPPAGLIAESDLILTGQILDHRITTERAHVESGFGNYDWAIDLTLKIQSIEKGEFDPSKTIIIRCFRVKSRKSMAETLTVGGNHPIPDVGSEVRAHLYRRGDLWRVVYPNGLVPVPDHAPLADAAAVRALSSHTYTYGLPIEGWIVIAVMGMVVYFCLRLIRRSRRHHSAE